MTIFGPDLSSYQDGIDVGALPHPFVIAKCTEGTFYTDRDYPVWRRQAAAHGKRFIPYHFISGEDPDAQARHFASAIGDKTLPAMIDFEPAKTFRPTLPQLLDLADACWRQGLHIALAYLPRWYWQQLGSPDLRALDARGIHVVSSAYPGGSGYPGDGAAGWQAYGGPGPTPVLYQFTDAAPVQGQSVDMNAFRGSPAELESALHTTAPTGGTMTLDSTDARTLWSYSHGDKPDVHQTLTDAANHAASTDQKLDQVLARLAQAAPAPVDVDALAAALVNPLSAVLAPHIGGVDVDHVAQAIAEPVAHAVLMHMAADLHAG